MKVTLAQDGKSDHGFYEIFSGGDDLTCLSFLREATLKEIISAYSGSVDEILQNISNINTLISIWENVLIDAIYFLRINDNREAAFYAVDGKKQKTTMKTGDVDRIITSNVYGIDDLTDYFRQFTDFESTLYGADKYYRDHVVHPLNVWVTGLHILKNYGDQFSIILGCDDVKIKNSPHAKKKWFNENKSKNKKLKLSTAELSAMWTIIALTHDIGYPLEKVEKVNDQLEKMLSKFGNIGFSRSHFSFENAHDHLVRFLLKLISSTFKRKEKSKKLNSWVNHLRTKYYTKFSKSWEMFDHGIVSSLLLLKTLTFFIETDYTTDYNKPLLAEDARQFCIRSEILHAIASHTTPKIYHLGINNLSFLLLLCDDIQEWGRPTLSDIRSGLGGNAKSVKINNFLIDDISKIECFIEYDKQQWIVQARFILRIFKSWLERFRPALDDQKRRFIFKWVVKFEDTAEWAFCIDNTDKNILSRVTITGPNNLNNKRIDKYDNLSKIKGLIDTTNGSAIL